MASIERRSVAIVAIVCVAIALGVQVVLAGSGLNPDKTLLSIFTSDGSGYPSVAVRIDGHPISGKYLSYAVSMYVHQSATNGAAVSPQTALKMAIDQVVNRQVVLDEAVRRGFVVTDAEVSTYLAQQVQGALDAPSADLDAVLAANGDADLAAYQADPKVRQSARDLLLMRKLVDSLSEGNPKFDYLAWRSQLRAAATVEIFVAQ
ncbi:MAG: SurA N-terminal domain-containing protein [Chloroflexi bacterium]|nr:SurA N-terminal domain-containing protein [Chloroflexota bacterium]